MRRKQSRISRLAAPEIMLTPLIDTFCVLLIIFIVAAPMAQNNIRVDLPFGKTKENGTSQELVVTLCKDLTVFFNGYPVKRAILAETIKNSMTGRSDDTPVFIRADEKVAYGKVIEVVDELKQAGIRFVAMSTRPS